MLKKIGFYGLSHLGLCYSAAFAKKKFQVTAIDEDRNKINKLKKNVIDVFEKGLLEILKKKKILYSNKIDVLNKCEIVFFTNDVKTNSKNVSNIVEIKKKL
jgi:UDPglucose 6-dehydrogenase